MAEWTEKGLAPWKQSKEITGVSAGSMINFKATVAQEREAILAGRTTKIRRLEGQGDVTKNKGVNLRAQKDQESRDTAQGEKSFEQVSSRLKEKSLIYDTFISGGSERLDPEELKRADFMVDFEMKSWNQDKVYEEGEQQFYHDDINRENERLRWEKLAKQTAEEEERDYLRRQEKRTLLNQIIEETQEGRDKVSSLQEQRQRKIELRKQQIKKQAETQQKRKMEQELLEGKRKEAEEATDNNKKKLQLKRPTRSI